MPRTPSSPALDDERFELQVDAWARELDEAGAADADVLYLNHLTPMNEAAAREFPGRPGDRPHPRPRAPDARADRRGSARELALRRGVAERICRWAAGCDRLVANTPQGARRAADLLDLDPTASPSSPTASTRRSSRARSTAARCGGSTWSRSRRAGARTTTPAASATTRRISTRSRARPSLYSGRFTEVKRLPLLIEAYREGRGRVRRADRARPPRRLPGRMGGRAPDRDGRALGSRAASSSPAGTTTRTSPTSSRRATSSSTPRSTSSSARCWWRRWRAGCR